MTREIIADVRKLFCIWRKGGLHEYIIAVCVFLENGKMGNELFIVCRCVGLSVCASESESERIVFQQCLSKHVAFHSLGAL